MGEPRGCQLSGRSASDRSPFANLTRDDLRCNLLYCDMIFIKLDWCESSVDRLDTKTWPGGQSRGCSDFVYIAHTFYSYVGCSLTFCHKPLNEILCKSIESAACVYICVCDGAHSHVSRCLVLPATQLLRKAALCVLRSKTFPFTEMPTSGRKWISCLSMYIYGPPVFRLVLPRLPE